MSFWSFYSEQESADEPLVFDARDPVDARFESAREVLGLIPASPLLPPASRLWREIEARLAHDPEFMIPVLNAMRERPLT